MWYSGSGKTNLLYHMLMKPLLYYDRIHLYAKNLEQQKYKDMLQTLTDISNSVGIMSLFVAMMI